MLSSSGFRDALGERTLRFDRESGDVCECLVLRPELAAYHKALGQRVIRLASLVDERLVGVEDVTHEPATGRVTVISQQRSGLRLQQILRSAREHELVPDLTIALFFTTELLAAAHALHTEARIPHGAIAPDRVIVTPAGHVALADFVFAEAIEAAHFTPQRLWREFAVAPWFGEPFSVAGDVRQSALTGIALMLGKPLDAIDMPDGLDALLIEVEEAAMIRGGRLFAEPVIAWLTRALGSNTFDTAEDAAAACAGLLTDRERATARPAFEAFLEELAQVPEVLLPPAAPPSVVTAEPAASESSWTSSPAAWTPEPEAEPAREPEVRFEPEPSRYEPEREPEPAAVFTPEPGPERVAAFDHEPELEQEPDVMQEPLAVNGPMFSTRSEAPPSGASTTSWPPPPIPAFDVGPDAGPRVVSPSPLSLVQGGGRSKPVAPEPAFVAPLPEPVSAPVARSIEPVPLPPIVEPATMVTPPADAVTAETGAPIRLKGDTGIRLKDTSATMRSGATSLGLDDRPAPEPLESEEETRTPRFKIPWKYVAVAAVVLATGFAMTTMDWRSSARPEAKKSTPITAPPPPAVTKAPTTGALQVLSNNPGSKVLIDGRVRGETPVTIDDLEPGRHVVIVRAPNGNVRRAITITAGKTTTLDLMVYSGWVVVSAPIELQVFDGEKPIGNAGEGPIVLNAGTHELVLVNEALGYRSTHGIDVQPGEEKRIAVDPKGTASFNAVPWAEVWVDGNKLGDTPLGNVEVPLGIREFTFKHPEHGERKVTATITASGTAQISVDFTK